MLFTTVAPILRSIGDKLAVDELFANLIKVELATMFATVLPICKVEEVNEALAPMNIDAVLILPAIVVLPATVILFPKTVFPVMFAVPATVNLLFLAVVLAPITKFPLPLNLAISCFAIIPLTWNIIGFPVGS